MAKKSQTEGRPGLGTIVFGPEGRGKGRGKPLPEGLRELREAVVLEVAALKPPDAQRAGVI